MQSSVLDSVVEDLTLTLPLIHRAVHRNLSRAARERLDEGVSFHHIAIMKVLEESGTCHVARIGEVLTISRPQMTQLVDRLISLGFIERHPDQTDRRRINLTLTGTGRVMLKRCDGLMRQSVRTMLSCLNEEELRELSTSLGKIRAIFSRLQQLDHEQSAQHN